MTRKNNESHEFESIHIGKIIEEELRRQERTVIWLSRKIHCDRRNIYDIFSRTSIDTDLLYRISIALNTDFFAYYSSNLRLINNQLLTPPATITPIKWQDDSPDDSPSLRSPWNGALPAAASRLSAEIGR